MFDFAIEVSHRNTDGTANGCNAKGLVDNKACDTKTLEWMN